MKPQSLMHQAGAGMIFGIILAGSIFLFNQSSPAIDNNRLATPEDFSVIFRKVAADALPSIVSIESRGKVQQAESTMPPFGDDDFPFNDLFKNDPRFRDLFKNGPKRQPRKTHSMGSGFIIDKSGIVMTNNHVVSGAQEVIVKLHDGREYVAKNIKTDPRTDVAILHIEGAGELKPIKLGDSHNLQVGDWVVAIGSPFGLDLTVTQGIISGKGRARGIAAREEFLQTDAAINPGNSGGPLINLRGEVIGVNTAISSVSGGYEGIGFAIPIHLADWVGKQLVQKGVVQRSFLGTGIQAVTQDLAKKLQVEVGSGVVVTQVMKNSPAEKAKLETGDVIVELAGKKINEPPALQGVVEQLEPGKAYPLVIMRDGKRMKLNVTPEIMPEDFSVSQSEKGNNSQKDWGMELANLSPKLVDYFKLYENLKGVVVLSINSGSLAEEAGIKEGDLIQRVGDKTIASVEDFRAAIKDAALKEGVVIHLMNKNGKRLVVIRNE